MADETQNAPVAGTQTATEEKKLYVYYYSNPDGATKDERCHAIYTDVPFDVVPWRMHKEVPDASMSDPVWDNNLNNGLGAWKEKAGDAQGQILAEAQAKIKELDQAHNEVDQAVKAMQQVQAQSSQQNVALMKSFTAQTQNTNKMLATMQQTLAMVVKTVQNSATPEAPKADVPAQPATDKQENGGN